MNKVNLLRTVLHCVQAFTFDKTTSTSTTKLKCQCKFGKTLIFAKNQNTLASKRAWQLYYENS